MLAFSSYIQILFPHMISKKSTGWFTIIDVLVKLLDHVCILEDNQKYMEVGPQEEWRMSHYAKLVWTGFQVLKDGGLLWESQQSAV